MPELILIVFALITVTYAVKRSLYHMHMFQLNSYRYKRYGRFLKTNWDRVIPFGGLMFLILISVLSILSVMSDNPSLLIVILAIVYVLRLLPLILSREKVKKPLVYTKRVNRILAVMVIIYGLLLWLCYQISGGFNILCLVGFSIATPVIMSIANGLLKPYELLLNKYYYRDAYNILRQDSKLQKIGITGSYGKTSTKFMIEKILSQQYNTLVTPHSYNTPLGVIITVRRWLNRSHEVFVSEMGAKQKGDIEEICRLVNPNIGIITAVGPQHLETFGSLSNVIDTKFEMAVNVQKGGVCFVNGDSETIQEGMSRYPDVDYITYGVKEDNDLVVSQIVQSPAGSGFTIEFMGQSHRYHTKLFGQHNILNISVAIGVGMKLGISYERIYTGVKELRPVPNRLEFKKQGDYYILDDAFNSNPTGAKYALDVLDTFDKGHKIIMTPGMIELGEMDHELHVTFGEQIAEVCDYAVLVGKKKTKSIVEGLKNKGFDEEKIYVVGSVYEGFSTISSIASKGDIVLIENDLPDNYNE